MPKANTIRAIIFVIIVAVFMLGVIQLFLLRFEAGDVYPAYSTLRSDPVGSRAFYRGLENLRDTSIERNYRQLTELEFQEPTTFFYIGASVFDTESVPVKWVEAIERLTAAGGRLVLSFLPVEKNPPTRNGPSCSETRADKSDDPTTGPADGSGDAETDSDTEGMPSEGAIGPPHSENDDPRVTLKEQWGLGLSFADKPATRATKASHALSSTALNKLPPTISWHTALYFDGLDDGWRVIYTAEGRPVLVERPYGNGSLILSADSFFMSNEALRSERFPELLVWTVGHNAHIVFDETHLGIRKQPGVLELIKKHRFHWFILAIAVLAILFVWKNSVYFVPPPKNGDGRSGRDVYSSRDATQGLISLLRRNIPARQVLQICAREWRRTFQRHQRFAGATSDPTKTVFERIKAYSAQNKDPVMGYRRISKIISKGRSNE